MRQQARIFGYFAAFALGVFVLASFANEYDRLQDEAAHKQLAKPEQWVKRNPLRLR
jgi:hypothetical protein